MISLAVLGVVVAVAGILTGALDPFRAKPSQVTKSVETGYLVAMGLLLAVAVGFLVFWSAIEGIKNKRPGALAS
jgi:protein-S-isoprenylcysteine O-methyltransferase Ste14